MGFLIEIPAQYYGEVSKGFSEGGRSCGARGDFSLTMDSIPTSWVSGMQPSKVAVTMYQSRQSRSTPVLLQGGYIPPTGIQRRGHHPKVDTKREVGRCGQTTCEEGYDRCSSVENSGVQFYTAYSIVDLRSLGFWLPRR